jgi:hypothetical protein
MFKHIIASNRAGGWRKLKHERKAHARGADVPRAQVAVAN